MKRLFVIHVLLIVSMASTANIRLPAVISSNMVLQQQSSVKIWGWAGPAEKVFITPSWNSKTDSTVTTRGAGWQINIQTPAAGGPYTITLKGENTILLSNVMIGEVWICSGQSNMEMNEQWGLPDVKAELPNCATNNIHFFSVAKATSQYPQDDCKAEWTVCDSNSLKPFSAVAYFFGKKLNKDLNVPIGLINASWGGTPAEVWAPADIVNNDAVLKESAAMQQPYDWWPYRPGAAFNGMIAPLTDYAIAGALWYQGEGNTVAPKTYGDLLIAMIDAWRKAWDKDLPFYYVQIAPFTYGNYNIGGLLREQQTKAMSHNNVGMVVITDLVDDIKDIHPKNKHDVGYRLADWALAETYHKSGVVYKSPMYKNMEIQNDKLIVTFSNAPGGLVAKDKTVTEIFVAGADKIFYPAEAKIDSDKLIVWGKNIAAPVAVRYGFSNAGVGNLFSKEGLPVCPFRTDDWEVDTGKPAQ